MSIVHASRDQYSMDTLQLLHGRNLTSLGLHDESHHGFNPKWGIMLDAGRLEKGIQYVSKRSFFPRSAWIWFIRFQYYHANFVGEF